MRGALDIQAGTAAVVLASQAEAEAGVNHTKAMTPLRVAQAIAALGGGGAEVALPLRAWVETEANGGSDASGEAGNPGRPFATVAGAIGAGARVLCVGAGTFAGATVSIASLDVCFVGTGLGRTTVTTLRNKGQAMTVRDLGVHSVQFGTISTQPDDAAAGSAGVSGGNLTLQNVRCETVAHGGGRGGDAAAARGGGLDGGHAGTLTLEGRVKVVTAINGCGGDGGSAAWMEDEESPEGGADGGVGGNGGAMQGAGSLWAEAVSLLGGMAGGGAGDGADGAGGNGGDVTGLGHFRIATLDVSGRGVTGEAGDVSGCHFGQIGELQQMSGDEGNGGALENCSFLHIDAMTQNGSTGGGIHSCAYVLVGGLGGLGSDGPGNPPMSFLAGSVYLGGA